LLGLGFLWWFLGALEVWMSKCGMVVKCAGELGWYGCWCWLRAYMLLLLCGQHMLCMWWLCCSQWSILLSLTSGTKFGCAYLSLFGHFFCYYHLYFWLCNVTDLAK
jgi:hypothetical protein